jgi:DNA-binding CsgD family transcriptional regulator
MGEALADVYDEERVAAVSGDVAAAIDAATLGSGAWDDVPAALSRAFPGSFGGLYNMNFPESRLNFLSFQNMDPAFVKSYLEHFAYVNPWAAYWTSLRGDTVAVSEEVSPARSFAHTEFYNDWLIPQKDVDAAVGMKIVGDRAEAIHVLLHFPVALSGTYDKAAAEIMKRVRGNFARSVHLARMMRADAEGNLAESALVERSRCAAFVLDGARALREANQMAVGLFSSGQPVAARNRRCFLIDKDADARFGRALERLSRGLPTDETRIACRTSAGVWQIVMAALPAPRISGGILSLLPPQRMVLVLVTALTLEEQMPGDFSDLAQSFGLTPAEIRFCQDLFLGRSLSETAGHFGISLETARSRMKSILHKTGTSRQGQLMLLLSRLR